MSTGRAGVVGGGVWCDACDCTPPPDGKIKTEEINRAEDSTAHKGRPRSRQKSPHRLFISGCAQEQSPSLLPVVFRRHKRTVTTCSLRPVFATPNLPHHPIYTPTRYPCSRRIICLSFIFGKSKKKKIKATIHASAGRPRGVRRTATLFSVTDVFVTTCCWVPVNALP